MPANNWLFGSALSTGVILAAIGCGNSDPAGPITEAPSDAASAVGQAPAPQSPADRPLQDKLSQETFSPGSATPAAPIQLPAVDTRPEEIVRWFLEATRRGDDKIAAAMLSKKSLEETARRGLSVKPPGSPTMKYSIAQAQKAPNDGAYVKCLWTEAVEAGEEENIEVVWILGLRPQGWRITGMAAELPNSTEPIVIDFENPEGLAERVGGPDGSGIAETAPDAPVYNAERPNEGVRR